MGGEVKCSRIHTQIARETRFICRFNVVYNRDFFAKSCGNVARVHSKCIVESLVGVQQRNCEGEDASTARVIGEKNEYRKR